MSNLRRLGALLILVYTWYCFTAPRTCAGTSFIAITRSRMTLESESVRSAILARAREYGLLSNMVGALPNTTEGLAEKKRLLEDRIYPMYHPDVDMFGLVGKERVLLGVEKFFLEMYPSGLRFESVINGNVSPDFEPALRRKREHQSQEGLGDPISQALRDVEWPYFSTSFDDQLYKLFKEQGNDHKVTFRAARFWNMVSENETNAGSFTTMRSELVESIEFEQVDGTWYAKAFTYVEKPSEPVAVLENHRYGLAVHVHFPDALNRDKWVSAVAALAHWVEYNEPYCLSFSVSYDEKDQLKLTLQERYETYADFLQHKQSDAFQTFLKRLQGIKRQVIAERYYESKTVGFTRA